MVAEDAHDRRGRWGIHTLLFQVELDGFCPGIQPGVVELFAHVDDGFLELLDTARGLECGAFDFGFTACGEGVRKFVCEALI